MCEKTRAAPAINAGIITFKFLSYKLWSTKKLKITAKIITNNGSRTLAGSMFVTFSHFRE